MDLTAATSADSEKLTFAATQQCLLGLRAHRSYSRSRCLGRSWPLTANLAWPALLTSACGPAIAKAGCSWWSLRSEDIFQCQRAARQSCQPVGQPTQHAADLFCIIFVPLKLSNRQPNEVYLTWESCEDLGFCSLCGRENIQGSVLSTQKRVELALLETKLVIKRRWWIGHRLSIQTQAHATHTHTSLPARVVCHGG